GTEQEHGSDEHPLIHRDLRVVHHSRHDPPDHHQAGDPALTARVELATLDAHRAEMIESDPASIQQTRRGVVRLSDEAAAELQSRLDALLDEFVAREEPTGRRHSFLWSVVERPGEPDTAED
ncbi:hypothetical protein ABT261_30690, partial [Amycolatopsis sp. NPDC000740]